MDLAKRPDRDERGNVVFADGHVEFIYGATATKVEAELKAGQNPPPSYTPELR